MKINREKITRLINTAMRIEEESVPHLAGHIISAMDFLEKDHVLREKIITVMETLKKESTEHASILNGIINDIEKSNME